jgi:hypothetical protein
MDEEFRKEGSWKKKKQQKKKKNKKGGLGLKLWTMGVCTYGN